ncbi:aminotransferase [Flexivirga caeni]|uniref:aminotransferase n=1 Tax=Flexivirga caeni TaxID=2294115 RepID=UPI001FE9F257|nr:aminotransferase [Flexivirga caeni]
MVDRAENTDWLLERPEIDPALALAIARVSFGITGELTELGSQQDRNFLVTPADGPRILLKVNHPSVSGTTISLQRAVSDRLRDRGIATPRILSTEHGARSVAIEGPWPAPAIACAFEVVEGQTLVEAGAIDGALAEELGALASRVVGAFSDLDHEGADRALQWDLTRAGEVVASLVSDLPGKRRRACMDATKDAMDHLAALGDSLPRQIIHGDLTSDNVMRDGDGTHWVIDLGDAIRSWRVAELAVLAADVLGRTGDLAMVSRVVRGFVAQTALTEDELDAVWPLVVLRGAVLAVSGWSQLRIDPGNAYARERIEHEWEVFRRAVEYDRHEVTAQLRLAAGRPHRRGLTYAPVLAAAAEVVDLGVCSALLDRGRWTAPSAETELARDALARASVAATRFGETRLTRVSTGVGSPAPTRARCVELWTRPGMTVHAPYAAAIRSGDGCVELTDCGVILRIEGVDPRGGLGESVSHGEVIGRVAVAGSGLGRLRVSRRMGSAETGPLFALPDGEYEIEGAADPSVLVGVPAVPDPSRQLLRERRRRDRAMGGAAERYYADPPQIERGWGALLIDSQGRAYLDLVNNVTAIGHSHPRLAEAVSRQLHLLNTNSRFLYRAYADFTERLLEHSPDPALDTVIPVNSGSEAIDLAIKLVQVATGRRDVIAVREAYHGWTMAADSVSTSAFDNPSALASRPDWVHLVDAPNSYRGPHRGPASGPDYARQVAALCDRLADAGRAPAAFICEPVLGNAGGVIPPRGYLDGAYPAVRAHGGLAIADEVQVGYGRLGSAFWGSTMQGVVPDVIAVAKAAGNAFPLGAVITRREIVDALRREGMFFSSAAGAPAGAVAGATVLDVIRDEGLQQNAACVGAHLAAGLDRLAAIHPLLGTVHGCGLYQGIELVRDHETLEPATTETAWICERLLGHGVIVQPTSERQNVLKVKPPLTLTIDEADMFLAALDATLSELRDATG